MLYILNIIRRITGANNILSKLAQIEAELCKHEQAPRPVVKNLLCDSMPEVRKTVADSFISGHGIEIGAFASPLPVPSSARVIYVDKYNIDDLDENHKVAGLSMRDFGVDLSAVVKPDIVDDGECLSKVGDYSQDFVIANHVLEHFEDPIKGFKNMLRVLKHGGILYLSLPEMRHSFDSVRGQTTFEHIFRDYENGPKWSRSIAYMEFSKIFAANGMDKGLFPRLSGEGLTSFENEIARELEDANFSIHFHAWTMDGMMEMFAKIKKIFRISFETKLVIKNGDEVIFIFQKSIPHIE